MKCRRQKIPKYGYFRHLFGRLNLFFFADDILDLID